MSLICGIIPARMAAYRFPGKPLAMIHGKPMIQHVYEAAREYLHWDLLAVATCDEAIQSFCKSKGWNVFMTRSDHPRAMDRVAEAAGKMKWARDDIIVNIQGDEPMLTVDLIEAVVDPIRNFPTKYGATLLAIPIINGSQWVSPHIVKVVHDSFGRVLYTSRQPIPYMRMDQYIEGSAKRIGGIFGFQKYFLDWFADTPEHILEIAEGCDSNRICGNGHFQLACTVPYRPYYSVDVPEDIELVEAALAAREPVVIDDED